MKRPPVVATWLLLRLATHRSNEALVGDLTEEFQHHPSRLWYWQQALAAVLVSWWEDVRAHKLLTLRALALGTLLPWLYFRYLYLFVLLIGDVPRLAWMYSSEYPRVFFSVIPGALTVFTMFRLPMLVVGLWAARPRQARPDPVFGPVLRSW